MVGERKIIHLAYPSEAGKIRSAANPHIKEARGGSFDVACTPGSTPPECFTGETSAVTCPLCKNTEIFKQVKQEQDLGGLSDADRAAREFEATQANQ